MIPPISGSVSKFLAHRERRIDLKVFIDLALTKDKFTVLMKH